MFQGTLNRRNICINFTFKLYSNMLMMGYAIKMMILFFIKYLLEWVGCW